MAELAAKLGSAIDIMKGIAAAQQETSQAVEQFKKEQTASDIEKKKETERRKARYEARKASMLSAAGSDLSAGRSIKSQWDEQLSFMSRVIKMTSKVRTNDDISAANSCKRHNGNVTSKIAQN